MSTSCLVAGAGLCLLVGAGLPGTSLAKDGGRPSTASPIEHLVVIFQENVSFDHYFATYPVALNPSDEPPFHAVDDTPSVNGLGTLIDGQPQGVLLTQNPNANNPANGSSAINPFRLDRSQASTCDQDHNYGDEQKAFDQGLMDAFPASTGSGNCGGYDYGKGVGLVLGYFDGNTVTALWNYAQNFAMNDNSYGTTFGPSTPGLLNLVAGNTFPAMPSAASTKVVPNNAGPGTLVGDLDPAGDVCSGTPTVSIGGKNIGDLLNAQGVTWGGFMGGFDLTVKNPDGSTGCHRQSPATRPMAARPTTTFRITHSSNTSRRQQTRTMCGRIRREISGHRTTAAQITNTIFTIFSTRSRSATCPRSAFSKPIAAGDGHAGYSDPLLEQSIMLVPTINAIMRSPFWKSTAIIVMYDDSDGWYDHQMSPIVNLFGGPEQRLAGKWGSAEWIG